MISMSLYRIIIRRRSIRRFQQKPIKIELLEKFVNAARLAPSAANLQVLEYFIVTEKKLCSKIFETVGWAAYIKPSWTPDENERPTAYIIILISDIHNKYYQRDVSLSSENIILTAEEKEIGSCILYNINREKIREILRIPKLFHIDSMIALGYKAEQPVVEDLKDSVRYWRDKNNVLHVPKRKLEDIIHENHF